MRTDSLTVTQTTDVGVFILRIVKDTLHDVGVLADNLDMTTPEFIEAMLDQCFKQLIGKLQERQ